jgi:hypothetical protein
MHLSISSDSSHLTHRSLHHFPRGASGGSLPHTTVIIIVVSALVGGLLLIILFWRILSRFLRPRSAPLPPRQALVHQRELQLAAFTEHKNASAPNVLHDSSESALVPNVREWSVNTSNRASSYTPEADDGAGVGLNLHPPPQNFLHRIPHSASSSSSLPSSNDNSAPSSDITLPPTPPDPFSTSMSPTPSFRRVKAHTAQRPRPSSMVSLGTSYMTIRSRPSVRAAPHAPHSNVQIVLPAPLAPNLYEQTTGEGARVPSPFVRHSAYSESWRRSLADTWISVGQSGFPEPEPSESQHSHESMEKRSRRTRSTCL